MSTDNPNDWTDEEAQKPSKRVVDEEKTVDQKIKSRIIETRKRVAKREDDIFVGASLTPDVRLSKAQSVNIWSTTVRQFLRSIEPLLKSPEVEDSEYYYNGYAIYENMLYPPDGETAVVTQDNGTETTTEEIHWSLHYDEQFSKKDLGNGDNLFSKSFEPPEPKPLELHGLKSIIETEIITQEWNVRLNPGAPPAEPAYIAKPRINRPLQKSTLEQAVRVADEFLQKAGIGLEIGHQTTDDKDEDPF